MCSRANPIRTPGAIGRPDRDDRVVANSIVRHHGAMTTKAITRIAVRRFPPRLSSLARATVLWSSGDLCGNLGLEGPEPRIEVQVLVFGGVGVRGSL
jgi:hypothetical protein